MKDKIKKILQSIWAILIVLSHSPTFWHIAAAVIVVAFRLLKINLPLEAVNSLVQLVFSGATIDQVLAAILAIIAGSGTLMANDKWKSLVANYKALQEKK